LTGLLSTYQYELTQLYLRKMLTKSQLNSFKEYINEVLNEQKKAERTTMYKNNSRNSSKFKGCSSLRLHRKLKNLSFEVGNFS